jgi:hypothetical protein
MLLKLGYWLSRFFAASRISRFGSMPNTRFPFFKNSSDKMPVPEPTSAMIAEGESFNSSFKKPITSGGYLGRYLM